MAPEKSCLTINDSVTKPKNGDKQSKTIMTLRRNSTVCDMFDKLKQSHDGKIGISQISCKHLDGKRLFECTFTTMISIHMTCKNI